MNRKKFLYALAWGAGVRAAALTPWMSDFYSMDYLKAVDQATKGASEFAIVDATTLPSGTAPVDIWNAFKASVDDWIKIVNVKPKGTVSPAEYAAWSDVKNKWHKVERVMGEVYR